MLLSLLAEYNREPQEEAVSQVNSKGVNPAGNQRVMCRHSTEQFSGVEHEGPVRPPGSQCGKAACAAGHGEPPQPGETRPGPDPASHHAPGPNGAAILAGSSPWVGKVTAPVRGPWGALRKKMPDGRQGTLMLSGRARWELAALSPLGSRQG